jgi:pimeloyl-ACP methyl ester carboxylesterase
VRRTTWLGILVCCGLWQAAPARATHFVHADLDKINARLAGHIVDHTDNHGADRRFWSPALQQWRDMYVYLPPGYDPSCRYPVIFWLHGFLSDEQTLLDYLAEPVDRAIVAGCLPPVIVAVPDGTPRGHICVLSPLPHFINCNLGPFEDYTIQDAWGFLVAHYPICPEREAHVIGGFSMGGFGAYNLGFKHPELFGTIIGICAPVNPRYVDCHGRYMRNFDPCCWGWRQELDKGREVIGRFAGGIITVRVKKVLDPVFGRGPGTIEKVSRENPIEMIDRLGIREGMYHLYMAYGGRDQYNIDAQVDSFLYLCKLRGLTVEVDYDRKGRHDMHKTGAAFLPRIIDWLAPRLAPYSPAPCAP